jgi:hypothetical protein
MNLNVFEINSAADDGVWIALQDAEFKIARAQNPRFVSMFQQRTKPYRAALDMDMLDESVAAPLWAGIFADAILLDWRGNVALDGQPLIYSRENAVKLLSDKRLKFFGWVREQANILENTHVADSKIAVEAVGKN